MTIQHCCVYLKPQSTVASVNVVSLTCCVSKMFSNLTMLCHWQCYSHTHCSRFRNFPLILLRNLADYPHSWEKLTRVLPAAFDCFWFSEETDLRIMKGLNKTQHEIEQYWRIYWVDDQIILKHIYMHSFHVQNRFFSQVCALYSLFLGLHFLNLQLHLSPVPFYLPSNNVFNTYK